MFEKTKDKINIKLKLLKKAAFLAFVGYLYDKIANRKKGNKSGNYIENIEYEIKNEDKNSKA